MRLPRLRAAVAACLAALGLGATALDASAQAYGGPAPGFAPAQRDFYFVLSGGLTGGGDKLAEVRYSNGDREAIRAGGLFQLNAGLLWQPALAPVSVQATIGWHADSIDASNGDVVFSRVPVEVLGYFTGVPRWRFGGGARFVRDARLETDVDGFSDTLRFRDSTGLVLEAGYQIAPRGWLNVRFTDEEYEAQSFNGLRVVPTGTTSARSVGVNLLWMF